MKIKLSLNFLLILLFSVVRAATPPNAAISYPSPWCVNYGELYVTFSGTTGGTFSSTPGLAIDPITGTISPAQSAPGYYTVNYSIAATAQDPAFVCTTQVALLPEVVPVFSIPTQYCFGSQIPGLPTTSTNGITGTWSPALVSNQQSGVYTFTPIPGVCASPVVVTIIIVNGSIQPEFGFTNTSFCSGNVPALPTTSLNGISGTWNPSVITTSDNYIFTPDAGQCAIPRSEYFTVNPLPTATISATTPVCQGESAYITITGTPSSVVTYAINSGPLLTTVLNPSGMATLATGPLISNTIYCLISVSSGGVMGCTANLTGCSAINVTPSVVIHPMPDIVTCDSYTLPALSVGNYYLQPNGMGSVLNAGTVFSMPGTTTVYVNASSSCGTNEESFTITVMPSATPIITTENDVNYIYVDGAEIAQSLLLNATLPSGNYSYQWMLSGLDIPGENGPTYLVNTTVQGGIHAYTVRVTNLNTGCIIESSLFEVFETPVPAPIGDPNQTFTPGQTLADVVIYGQNIQWYDSLNRGVNSVALPLSTVLQEGVTYYATQTINGHESPSAFSITIQFLATDSFAFRDLKFAPNPVGDFLQLSSKDVIQKVTVLNLIGQKILQQNVSNQEFSLPMSQLKTGNYFVKLESENKSQVIKVIKE